MGLELFKGYKLTLASNSPRRQELLRGLAIDFTVKTIADIDESYPNDLRGEEISVYIAKNKAKAYRNVIAENEILITADTVVHLGEEVLGKPKDRLQAIEMLKKLSGKQHQVTTGVCIATQKGERTFSSTTEVSFAALTEQEIIYYVDHYQPMDKAGAYGIQEWIGFIGVEEIKGSFYNVMGLPIQKIYRELLSFLAYD